MYANQDNPPPPKEVTTSGLNTDSHLDQMTRLAQVILMIIKARKRSRYCCTQYHEYSPSKSPFVTRSRWKDDMDKWAYIHARLEIYYYKKTCELTSSAYEQLIRG